MTKTPDRDNLHKIVVLNPKGGSGKTTLATNLASFFSRRGPPPTLVDCDPQGYSMRWLDKRSRDRPAIHGIAAYKQSVRGLSESQSESWADSGELIIDLPAGIPHEQLFDKTYDAHSILIPVLPSAIDVYSASRFIAELLLVAQIDRRDRRLAVIANRTRQNTRSYQMLMRFLNSLRIPLVANLRDSQNYVYAAAEGIGIYEMPPHLVRNDVERMDTVIDWLDQWRMRKLDASVTADFEHIPGAEILTPAVLRH